MRGRVVVAVHDPVALTALVWGQYARVGRNLHFGFGRYRIERARPGSHRVRAHPFVARPLPDSRLHRTVQPRTTIWSPRRSGRPPSGCDRGPTSPAGRTGWSLRESDGGTRELHIPPIPDRALQRLILARFGPALDRLFESSSFAWRKGLSREAAARRIERLVHDGWRMAVKADFDRFFDRVPRRIVRDRLEAWIGDDRAAAAIMTFVDEGATSRDRPPHRLSPLAVAGEPPARPVR